MSNQTTVQKVQGRISDILKERADILKSIEDNKAAALETIAKANRNIRSSTEKLDLDAFEAAKVEKQKAQMAVEMYDARLTQVSKQELITESESDKTLDSLKSYADELKGSFLADVAVPLKQAREILSAYMRAVVEVDETMHIWQQKIHANYRSSNGFRTDPVTGKTTRRFEYPIEMHAESCQDAVDLDAYLKKAADLLK